MMVIPNQDSHTNVIQNRNQQALSPNFHSHLSSSVGILQKIPTDELILDIPLAHIPIIEPRIVQLLRQRGFDTVRDIYESMQYQQQQNDNHGRCTFLSEINEQLYSDIMRYTNPIFFTGDYQSRLQQSDKENQRYMSPHPSAQNCMNNDENVSKSTGITQAVTAFEIQQNLKNHKEQIYSQTQTQSPGTMNSTGGPSRSTKILTFCRALDVLLGGGIGRGGCVTEICGPPGSGKSQLGMQLAINTSLPTLFGGVNGHTIYIDTEGNFSPTRCHTMATGLLQHLQRIYNKRYKQESQQHHQQRKNHSNVQIPQHPMQVYLSSTTPADILNGIYVFRVHDDTTLLEVIHTLVPELVQEKSQTPHPIRCIILDTIAYPFRSAGAIIENITDNSVAQPNNQHNNHGSSRSRFVRDTVQLKRSQQLLHSVTTLGQLGYQYDVGIVTLNQMTTKWDMNQNNVIVPALSDSWAHAVTIRLILSQQYHHQKQLPNTTWIRNQEQQHRQYHNQRRIATLVKAPSLPPGSIEYQIVNVGIRGVEYEPPN